MIHISNTYTRTCVCVSLAKSEAIMNSPPKAKFIATTTEDIDHVQYVPDLMWLYLFICTLCILFDGHALVRNMNKPTCRLGKLHKSTFSSTGDNIDTMS